MRACVCVHVSSNNAKFKHGNMFSLVYTNIDEIEVDYSSMIDLIDKYKC